MHYTDFNNKSITYTSENLNQSGCMFMMLNVYDKALDYFHKSIACRPLYLSAWQNACTAAEALELEDSVVYQYKEVKSHIEKHTDNAALSSQFYPCPELPMAVLKAIEVFWKNVQDE